MYETNEEGDHRMGVTRYKEEATMKVEKAVMKKRGQLTIPKSIRDALKLEEDSQLEVTIQNGAIVLQPVITIARDQAWFWSDEWQEGEREAEQEIKAGNFATFNNLDELFADLNDEED